jgi:hypothetical protein
MDASKSESREGHESSGTDSNRETTSGTSRRSLLALIAALATLPAATSQPSSAKSVDVSEDPTGTKCADVESGEPVFGAVDLHEYCARETKISVDGYNYDGKERNVVEVTIYIEGATVTMSCSTERAHELADELRTAAEHVEGSR